MRKTPMSKEPLIVSLMGITNSGKSTIINAAKAIDYYKIGFVEVGKEMRRRYPPETFKGKGAMASTEDEVLEIYHEQLQAAKDSGAKLIFIDGQPRMACQVPMMLENPNRKFLVIKEDDEVILERIKNRDTDPKAVELSMLRFNNDKVQLFDVMTALLRAKEEVYVTSVMEDFHGEVDILIRTLITQAEL